MEPAAGRLLEHGLGGTPAGRDADGGLATLKASLTVFNPAFCPRSKLLERHEVENAFRRSLREQSDGQREIDELKLPG